MSDIESHAIVVGVTGGIACGKSEVGRILESMGFKVCDADHVAHSLMAKGSVVYRNVLDCFGNRILSPDGEISRPSLGKIVFEDRDLRERLNRLVHPSVRSWIRQWIDERRALHENGAVLIPLLFESGMDDLDFDGIICVSSSETLVFERLEKRGMDRSDAIKRVLSQMPLREKEGLSDCVVGNSGSLQELEQATRQAIKDLSVEKGRI